MTQAIAGKQSFRLKDLLYLYSALDCFKAATVAKQTGKYSWMMQTELNSAIK